MDGKNKWIVLDTWLDNIWHLCYDCIRDRIRIFIRLHLHKLLAVLHTFLILVAIIGLSRYLHIIQVSDPRMTMISFLSCVVAKQSWGYPGGRCASELYVLCMHVIFSSSLYTYLMFTMYNRHVRFPLLGGLWCTRSMLRMFMS